jgi:protein ImuB
VRIACIHVPAFPLAAWWRADPELHGAPLIVTDAPGPRAPIVAAASAAVQRGIAAGMTAAQAMAIASDLVVRVASPAAEHAAQAALCDVAYSCSPRVEESGMGTVYCDADGLRELYASETDLARGLVARARALGLAVSVGIAATKIAAQLAARDGGGSAVIPPHDEWRFLAPLPVHLLAPEARLQETLTRWGIRTLGDLAALPASAVATRLGPAGAQLARRARGEDEHALVARPLPVHFEETAELDYGVDNLEPFLFVVRGLLDRLTARLALRGLICGDLRLSLGLVGRGRDERIVTVAAPSNEIKPLLTLLRLHLEAQPPSDAVETVRLGAVPERLRPMQLDLFRPNGPAPAQLAATLARLAALCGADRLGAPVVVDSHRPEAYGVEPFHVPRSAFREGEGGTRDAERGTRNVPIALRALRPAQRLDVFCNRGQPDFIRLADPAAAVTGCTGRVVTLAGPWRLQGDWWRPDAFHRDYYDAHLSDGAVYRVFFDLVQQQWFVDGVYD